MTHIFASFFVFMFFNNVNAELVIDITEGNIDPIPLAITEFNTKDSDIKKISQDINNVINNNLENCSSDVLNILNAERKKRYRQKFIFDFIAKLLN